MSVFGRKTVQKRAFFYENGFSLEKEVCAVDGRHVYCAMAAHFTGDVTVPSPALPFGGLLFGRNDPAARRFLNQQLTRLKKRCSALEQAGTDAAQIKELRAILQDFENRMSER